MTMLAKLRAMAAGDGLYGLIGEQFEQAAKALPLERKRALRREALDRLDALRAEIDAARHEDEADAAARITEALDKGRRVDEIVGPNAPMPKTDRAVRRVSGLAAEFGLRCPDGSPVPAGSVLEALAIRVQRLSELLEADYRAGEPAALKELRRELSRAKASEWDARRAHEEQQRRYNALRDAEAERVVMAAHAEVVKAGAAVKLLRERLAREWAITV